MQSASAHQQDSCSGEKQAEFLRRRLNYVVGINFSFFAGYLLDQLVIPGGNAGIVAAAVFAVFMTIRLCRIESAAIRRNALEEVERRSESTV